MRPATAVSPISYAARRAREPLALAPEEQLSLRVRRWLYHTLEPIDKGDFRWEFLVPFNNKTLTTLDKFIVCSAFIGVSFSLQTVFEPGASVGVHLSYIAQFFSYAMGDPIGFRSLAVLTSLLEIGGNLFEAKEAGLLAQGVDFNLANAFASVNAEDVFPILYDQLFIIINGYYIIRWLLGQEVLASAIEWEEDEEGLYSNCFAPLGFRRAQFSRLLRSTTILRAEEAVALTVQGEPVLDLFVPLNGTVEVRVGGAVASTLPPYQLVGEASLLENLQSQRGEVHPPARATVVATAGSFYARWPQSAFFELQQEEDSDFGYAIQLMIARTLSSKLSAARLSQRESEQRLKSRVSATMRGASPRALAARRLGLDESEADAARRSRERPGAEAEVAALLKQYEGNKNKIRRLEGSLQDSEREVSDLKLLGAFLASVIVVQVASWSYLIAPAVRGVLSEL